MHATIRRKQLWPYRNNLKLYNTVIEDVIAGVREAFLDEGVDEQVLQELKQIWETKLMSSKAVELNPDPPEPQPPQLNAFKNSSSSKGGSKRNTNTNITNAQANIQPQAQSQIQESPANQPQIQQQSSQPQSTHIQSPQPQARPQQSQLQQSQNQQQQVQHIQHMQSMPVQQVQQIAQHQSIPQQQQQIMNQPAAAITDRQVSIQIKLPIHGNLPERLINVHVPASAIQGNQLHAIFTGPIITAAIALPVPFATSLLQQHVNSTFEGLPGFTPVPVPHPVHVVPQGANNIMQQQLIQGQQQGNIAQLDGAVGDSSDEDDDEEEEENDDDEDLDEEKEEEENDDSGAREEEPLNSEDDVTDDDPTDLFDTDNVVVCQYDKITRSRNKWKFYLKDGIMNLSGKDFVFQKANGDAEW
ncbi:PREDICTED: transcription initiation factor IIA subunit 1 isoform X2 [Ceratosolen solmsi marchali]|uniref:Transcription initiation factor IIA subunit 1 isoform X2 n=1 Tax=Ceratosolen solmsi marchali TaxID=326594 RepID=A0AAJ6YR02_9HYME|nr:PREDICTED: transcription initiation factor IIA subunit 1 isoform X2 [Ceratosolen solmsi marchali]